MRMCREAYTENLRAESCYGNNTRICLIDIHCNILYDLSGIDHDGMQ